MLAVIQNDPEVPCGNLADFLTIPYRVCRIDQGEPLPAADRLTALIVLGGAMGANDDHRYPFLTDLKGLIHTVVVQQKPYLGICLGGQLLAAALGARVVAHRWEEQGNLPVRLTTAGMNDPLFAGIPEHFTTFQWHHDSFDLPEGATLLASSPACPHQAFRIGGNAWGLQFHPEVTEQIIRDWCGWDPATARKTEEIVAIFADQLSDYRRTARIICANFCALAASSQKGISDWHDC